MAAQLQESDDKPAASHRIELSVEEEHSPRRETAQKLDEIEQNGATHGMTAKLVASTTAACASAHTEAANNTEETTHANNNVSNTSANDSCEHSSQQASRHLEKPQQILNTRKITGIVKWFSARDGYGFIKRNDNGEDVFVHRSAILHVNPKHYLRSLGTGEAVEFDLVEVKKGTAAANVTGPAGREVRGNRFVVGHAARSWSSYGGNRRQPRANNRRQEDNVGFERRGRSTARYNYGREDRRAAASPSRARRYNSANQRTRNGGRNAPNCMSWREGERNFSPAYRRNNNRNRPGRGRSYGFRNEGNNTNSPNSRNVGRANNRDGQSAVRIALPRNNDDGSGYETVADESHV